MEFSTENLSHISLDKYEEFEYSQPSTQLNLKSESFKHPIVKSDHHNLNKPQELEKILENYSKDYTKLTTKKVLDTDLNKCKFSVKALQE